MVYVNFCTCIAFIMRVYLLLVIGMFFKNSKKITEYDLIVVGNNLAAVVSAGMAAKSGKSVASVEKAIRTAVEVSWNRGKIEILEEVFGFTVNLQKGKPTNTEYIAMLADRYNVWMK